MKDNSATDAIYRINQLNLPPTPNVDLDAMAQVQGMNPDIDKLTGQPTKLNVYIYHMVTDFSALRHTVRSSKFGGAIWAAVWCRCS